MKKYIFITACLFIFAGSVNAQQKKSSLIFSSINTVGFLNGQSQTTFTMQSINGVKSRSWFAGLGAGIDPYGCRSIPAFADIRKTFGNKDWQPFIYADAGINFPLYNDALPRKQYDRDAYKFYNTFYGEAGIGLSKPINNKTMFILSAGFTYKHFNYLQYNYYYYPIILQNASIQRPSVNATQFDFYYRRVAIKMGLQF